MQQNTEPKTAAEAAAQWWARAVSAPTYDNGDPTGMSGMLMTLVAERQPNPSTAQRASFAEILAPRLQAKLDLFASRDSSDVSVCVGVDYGPDPLLADAAREAGVSPQKFPWKTTMWVYPDRVTVSAGYGAGTTLVWASEEWVASRPVCDSQKWDETRSIVDYNGDPFACSLPIYHDGQHRYDRPIDLCTTCGRRDGWYHRRDERGHMADFHEFAAPQGVTA